MEDKSLPQMLYGTDRTARLRVLLDDVRQLHARTQDARTVEVLLTPLTPAGHQELKSDPDFGRESWACAAVAGTDEIWCVDEVSSDVDPETQGYAALFFPELHTRLVSWWLSHAWRFVDLATATFDILERPFNGTSAVLARALMEDVGCMHLECGQLGDAWAAAKSLEDEPYRPWHVRGLLHPVLADATFATKMTWARGVLPEPRSVMTYIDKLGKATGNKELRGWYDWLTDAAHPAFAAKVVQASKPFVHRTGGVTQRDFRRRDASADPRVVDLRQVHLAADATIECAAAGLELLTNSLALVDDIGLTTKASILTDRVYWRNIKPTRGNRACPCGCGPWGKSNHHWHLPTVTTSLQAPRQ